MLDRKILREFMQGYLTCALWSSNDASTEDGGEPLDDNYGIDDIDAKSEAGATDACQDFIATNWLDLTDYVGRLGDYPKYTAWERAGHDFWLTRNGHGTGFWDRGLGPLGDRLSDAAKGYGEQYIYVGDYDTLYIGGFENYGN